MRILKHKSIKLETGQTGEKQALVQAQNVSVKYVIGNKREDIQSRAFNRLLHKYNTEEYWALKDISLVGYAGDIIGIIGLNGAGKTTLCRVISGLLRPDNGKIRVNGRVSALLTLGTGFNHNLSARENIFLNGMMFGLSKRSIKYLIHEIIAFSGLGYFVDEPLKNYSRGMKSRLGFSIAAMIEPEILIIDEALSAGDMKFSEKAGMKLQQIISNSKIVIVVTHQLDFVKKYCTRALWLDRGLVRSYGQPAEVIKSYKEVVPQIARKIRAINFSTTEPKFGESDVIKVKNIAVKYFLSVRRNSNDDRKISVKKVLGEKGKSLWALKDVNFSVNEGDVLGIIGRNGAGKTTLCKVISGILKPDRGEISIKGKITALLTFGLGFNIQLSGRDNIFLNGMMLGLPKKVLEDVYCDIVEFSGIKKFIEQPLKTYSSGMRARLGFSIVAMIKPDVLVIDEALNTGDISFYEKASAKIQELMLNSKAAIVVTHNMAFIEKICTRAIWIDDGNVKFDGSPKEAVKIYRQAIKASLPSTIRAVT